MPPTASAAGPGQPGGDPERFAGIRRDYTPEDVARLSGSFRIRHTLAEMGAARLWHLLKTRPYRADARRADRQPGGAAGQGRAGGDLPVRLAGRRRRQHRRRRCIPDQSLYPVDSVPNVVRRINAALRRADQIAHSEGGDDIHWMAPIVADAEAGFGGALNAFELMKAMIAAGAAGVHFEDQLASEKKCGHLGGKVLVPMQQHIRTLNAARLAADTEGVQTVLLCRTDAQSAQLLTTDVDERDRRFISGERTPEGFFRIHPGMGVDYAIARGLAFAPYADLLWWETSDPNLEDAERFANAIHRQFPGKMLAYNCSPSFNWKKKLPPEKIATFQTRHRPHGLQVPVRHVGRVPQPEPVDVQPGARLCGTRHGGVFGTATGGIRGRGRAATPRPGTSARSVSAISMRWRRRRAAASPPPRRCPAAPRRRSSKSTRRCCTLIVARMTGWFITMNGL